LKWIARLGSGMEIIDLKYCAANGIKCFSSPKGIANAVAEHAVGMLLSLQHRIQTSCEEIKHQKWNREANRGYEIENLTLGIIGYGHTGQAFAKKMSVFVKRIIAFDKYKKNFQDQYVDAVSLEELKHQADIISLHLPLSEETFHYYDAEFVSSIKQSHVLINTSRGAIANTQDIVNGFKSGKIVGACLDVLEEEKNIATVISDEHSIVQELLKYPVIITPHIAGYSYNAIEKMSEELKLQIENIL
jgi:D-3-phosphoglycerate dehydrogenase / 2-oxoglutarate reductase